MLKAFLGANTSSGFVSMYDNILTENKACKLHILKGGSGSGKSTFIKNIASNCDVLGLTYEEYHCSSDTNSLDGLYVPALGFAMVDGTSPHVVEPRAYGASDYIINMGDYIKSGVGRHLDEINLLRKQKSDKYKVAYSLIGAGGQLLRCVDELTEFTNSFAKKKTKIVAEKMSLSSQKKNSLERKMFLSALTSSGYVSYAQDLDAANILVISGASEKLRSRILELACGELTKCGYTFISFFSPLTDKYLQAVYVEEIDFLLLAENILDKKVVTNAHYEELNLTDDFPLQQSEVQSLNSRSKEMFEAACDKMREAAVLHAEIEKIYYPHMDFHNLSKMEEQFVTRLFKKSL